MKELVLFLRRSLADRDPWFVLEESELRRHLDTLGIDHEYAIVLTHEGPGSESNPASIELEQMISAGRVGILAIRDWTQVGRNSLVTIKLVQSLLDNDEKIAVVGQPSLVTADATLDLEQAAKIANVSVHTPRRSSFHGKPDKCAKRRGGRITLALRRWLEFLFTNLNHRK